MTVFIEEGLEIHATGSLNSSTQTFYNNVMIENRSLSVSFLKAVKKKHKINNVLDLMSSSGVRLLRFKNEVSKNINCVYNDYSKTALKFAKKNAKINEIDLTFENQNALNFKTDEFFDYVDLDPFGTPSPFVSHAISLVKNGGFLGVSATDISALYGTYVGACLRKYGSKPLRVPYGHEMGLRILIKLIINAGANQNTALKPLFCYSKNHYMRVYFQKLNKSSEITRLIKELGYYYHNPKTLDRGVFRLGEEVKGLSGGLFYLGKMFDDKLLKDWDNNFVNQIRKEEALKVVGFYHIPNFTKKLRKTTPKTSHIIDCLKNQGHKSIIPHYKLQSLKTTATVEEFKQIL